MFDVVLVAPETPSNAGNAIRLVANTGYRLHLVEPLGFSMGDRQLRRASLDYHYLACLTVHRDWAACAERLGDERRFVFTARGSAGYASVAYAPGDVLVFGAETRGLPEGLFAAFPPERRLRLPM